MRSSFPVRLISVGSLRTSWIKEGCDVYRTRLAPLLHFSETEVADGTIDGEAKKILSALDKAKGEVVILDETGAAKTSAAFSKWLSGKMDSGTPVTFVIGGAYGLHDEVRKRATLVLSMGPMTFPHEIARLLFLEQLYRATQIIAGKGYHH